MKVWNRIVISLSLVIVGVSLAIAGFFIYATSDVCGNEIYSEVLSPNGEHKVVIFQRDCGATTGFSTQISIIGSDNQLGNESGNIFIINGHPNNVSPHTRWASNKELRIERSLTGSEYKAETGWGFLSEIKVTYGAGGS